MLSRTWSVGLAVLVVGTLACSQGRSGPDLMAPEIVPAAQPATMPGGAVAGRFWGEIDPKAGKIGLYPIHEGNVIYRAEQILSAVNFQYGTQTQETPPCAPGGTCLPGANLVTLFTDQNTTTYVEAGDCYKNGLTFTGDRTCGGFYQAGNACTQDFTFCGDIQITSNVTFGGAVGAMPDVVLDIGNVPAQPSTILGCRRNNTAGGESGLCNDDGPTKIAAATSNFVPQISPDFNTLPCAYCYGNKTRSIATNRPALQHTVISGASAEKALAFTTKTVLKLSNGNSLNTTFIVYFAKPAVNAPGAQIGYSDVNGSPINCVGSIPTRALIKGGGFGPPAACIAASFPGSCPELGAPAAGYTVSFAGLANQSPLEWSDTQLRSQSLPTDIYGCTATVTTPVGTVTTDDDLQLCSGNLRRWTPSGYLGRSRVGGGKTNGFAVVMGGLSDTNSVVASNTIQSMPLPRCSNPSPAFTTLTTQLPAGAGLWAPASTAASDGIYYVGGADSGNTCSKRAFRFTYSGGATGTFTALPDLPVVLCHGTAVNVFDRTSGSEYVVVTGGLTFPVHRLPEVPALSDTDLSPTATYIWTVGGAAWTTFNGIGLQRWNMGGAGHRDATAVNNKALFVGGATSVANFAPAVSSVNVLTVTAGTPSYAAAAGLPQARSAPAVVDQGGNFYVQGGATTVVTFEDGRSELFRIAAQPLGGAWTTVTTGPLARQGHLLILSDFAETLPNDTLSRLLMVSGSDRFAFPQPDEFNP